jgi:GNAT superfamily N-acetyltransferase
MDITRVVRLEPDDWPRLRVLRLRSLLDAPDAFGSTYEEALAREPGVWIQQLRDLPTFVAISDDGADVGLVRYAPNDPQPETGMLISMWVAPEARRHGLGGVLIDAIIDYARSQNAARLLLDVADHSIAAIALYASKGFTPTGEGGSLPAPRNHIREHRRALQLRR